MSTQRAELIAAILDDPDDDDLRLVCADWFEEHGEAPRAEFIRTQLRRAQLPADDPEQAPLQAQELRLLKQYGPQWCGSHFVFKKCRFRRGFIEAVHLHLQHYLHHRRQMLALEPVRDVRLTGWYRAPEYLVKKVAGCEELRHVERLRLHHQGPHRHPRNVIDLLESPHLTGLRAFECPMVELTAEDRRRFEQLKVLRSIRELQLPYLETFPEDPGPWFSDGIPVVEEWNSLRSLTLPWYLRVELLQQLMDTGCWNRLTSLDLRLAWEPAEALTLLIDRLPPSLETLRIESQSDGDELGEAETFFHQLADLPLQSLHLSDLRFSAATLGRVLGRASGLRELTIRDCNIGEDHLRVLADSPSISTLQSFDLASNTLSASAAASLASLPAVSVVRLNLSGTSLGNRGIQSLAQSSGWNSLRMLDLSFSGIETDGLRAFLNSPAGANLTWLVLQSRGYPLQRELDFTADLVSDLNSRPNLEALFLAGPVSDGFGGSESPAWMVIEPTEDYDVQAYRDRRAPERMPPVDDSWECGPEWLEWR